jgi:succinoglycan biosynthesis transport protein ExoP
LTVHSHIKTTSDEYVDPRRAWSIISRNTWAVLGLAGAASLFAALVVFAMTPIYEASVTILIESQQANVVSIEEVYELDTRSQQYYATQFEILNSRPLVEDVVETLELTSYPEFAPNDQSTRHELDWRAWISFVLPGQSERLESDPLQEVIESYYDKLTIEPIRNTQLVNLRFESEEPALAARVANSHAEAYIQSVLGAQAGVTDSAATWMLERLEGLQDNLLESEQRLQEFREQEQLIDVEGLKSLPAREINELTSRLVEVRGELSQARIAYTQVYQGRDTPLEDLGGIPAILDDRVVQELQQAEAQAQGKVAEISKRYGPAHPQMVAVQSELSKATENLRNQHRSVAEAIRNTYEAARAEEAELVKALDRAKQQYQQIGRKESGLLALEREADTNRNLYDLFYNRISETTATGGLESAPARIISPAVVPAKPSKPMKLLVISLVFAISLMIGVTAAFLVEALNNTVRSAADVEEKLRLPLLGMLPQLKAKRKNHGSLGNVFFDKAEPAFNEAIRTVRTGISLDNLEHPHKVIVITSSISGEGKSTVAMNFAHAFAKSENVLLLEADMRRPSIGRALNLRRVRPGLSELLAEKAELSECVYRGGKDQMNVLLSGSIPPDPSQLLSSRRLVNALLVLRRHYDRIIVDTPPLLPVSDGLVLSAHADTVIFVAKSDATSIHQINQALDLLLRVNARVTGIVVNQLDTRKAAKYSDYGYGGYFETYESLAKAS